MAINLPGGTFFASKELILNRITAILAAYRKYCATSSSAVSRRMRSQHRLTLTRLAAVADNSCSPLPGLHLEAITSPRASSSVNPNQP